MGCSQFSRTPIIGSVVPKPPKPLLISSESSNTMSATNIISIQPSLKLLPSLPKPCLKIKLLKSFNNFIVDDITTSDKLSRKMHKIRKYCIFLTALQNSFEHLVHSVCIDKYTIKSGLTVFVVLTAAKCGFNALAFSKSFPYIECNKDKESVLYQSWKALNIFLNSNLQKKVIKTFEAYEVDLENFIIMNDASKSWYARKAVKALQDFNLRVKSLTEGIFEFMDELETNKTKFVGWVNEANMAGISTPGHFVHLVMNRN